MDALRLRPLLADVHKIGEEGLGGLGGPRAPNYLPIYLLDDKHGLAFHKYE